MQQPKPFQILRWREVIARLGVSRPTIERAIRRGEFPPPLRLGPRAVGWDERDVEAWLRSRVEREAAHVASD